MPNPVSLCNPVHQDIKPAYTALSEWIEMKVYKAMGVAYELYLNYPSS